MTKSFLQYKSSYLLHSNEISYHKQNKFSRYLLITIKKLLKNHLIHFLQHQEKRIY
jgi:hypothetical protein